jgi:hypothetical protein
MKLTALNALAAACLAVAAGPVFANAYSSATIGNVTITLIDLDLNDGVAASISFLPDLVKYSAGANIGGVAQSGQPFGSEPGKVYDNFAQTGAWSSTNVTGLAHNALATSSVSVTGSATGLGFSAASLTGSALSSSTQPAYFYGEAYMPNSSSHGKFFNLSANTQVVFSFDAAMSVNTTIGHNPGASDSEHAMAQMMLYAGGLADDGVTVLEDLQQKELSVFYTDGDPAGGASDSWSGTISASFSNLSSHTSMGEFASAAHSNLTGG